MYRLIAAGLLALVGASTAFAQPAAKPARWQKCSEHLDWKTATHVVRKHCASYPLKKAHAAPIGYWTATVRVSPHVERFTRFPEFARPASATFPTSSAGYWTAVWATAYDDVGTTATGAPAGYGGCAAHPWEFPYGTVIYAPGYGRCVITDTGGGGSNWIDFWLPTQSQCLAWTGYHRIFVYR